MSCLRPPRDIKAQIDTALSSILTIVRPTHHNMILDSKLNRFDLLPTELLNTILDHLYQDIASLKACSIVCHTLLPVCQAHLFHTASLELFVFNTGPGPVSSHRLFLNVISTSPHLAALVRVLKFTKPRRPRPAPLRLSEEERGVHQEVVAQILVAVPRLKTLVIRTSSGSLLWRRLSAVLTTALSEVVQVPSLRFLDLGTTWEAPPSFFANITNIEVLRFAELHLPLGPRTKNLVTSRQTDNPTYGHVEHGRLQSLSILTQMTFPCIDALFLRPARLLDITHLRSLTLAFINDELIVRNLLEVCGQSLHTFRVHIQPRGDPLNEEPDIGLQYLQCVTSLTLSSSIVFTKYCELPVIRWLTVAMSTLPSLERLKDLTIIFEIMDISDILIWEENIWSTLNSLRTCIPGLCDVHLLFHLIDPTVESERLLTFVQERTVSLVDVGILKISTISRLPSYFL